MKPIYSKLAIARESATITYMWQRLEGRVGKLYSKQKRRLWVCFHWMEAVTGKPDAGLVEAGHPM